MRFRKPLWPSLCVALLAGTFFVSSGDFVQAQTALPKPAPSAAFPGLATPEEPKDIINELLASGQIIRSSDVKRGMRGYGLSVFQGTTIEKFPVEVLGVLQKVNGGGDIVLIKVLGGTVVKRNSGIVAGMSGSPVYINGKMLGAIALGWGFPKEPIGGVTPITEMLQTSLPKETPSSRVAALATSDHTAPNVYAPREALNVGGKEIKRVVVAKNATRLALNDVIEDAQQKPDTAVMRPTSTLLQVSGFSQDSLAKLKKVFEPYGLEPFIGPSSKKTGVPSPKIEPGAAVGVQLVSGDMDQTAVGTITFRWGNRVLAFGHPMFGQGATSLPMTSAYVYDIFPSYQSSFKLASPIKVIGAIQQDTQFAIGGTMNVKADTIPMRISLVDANRRINKTIHVQIMNDPLLTPQLVVMVAQQAVEGTLGLTSDKMVDVAMRMDVAGAKPIIRHNLLYSGGVVSKAALTDLMQSISLVQGNQFAKGRIRDISLEVSVRDGRNIAAIKTITANRNKVKAGESIQINVVLQPTADPTQRITRTFTFKVPADAPAGTMRLAAASAANFWPLQVAVGGPAPDPTSLPELISAWNKVGSLNDLVVMASTPEHFLRVDQQDVQNPPPAWSKLLGNSPSTGVERYNQVDMQHTILDYAIDGAKILRIPVESAHKNNASADSTDDSSDDDSVTSADDTTPDDSATDDGAVDNTGDDTSTKSTFDVTNGELNSSKNWNNTSWNDKLTVPVPIPYQVVPGAPSAKPNAKDADKKTAADTAAAIAAAMKAAEAAASEESSTATPPTTLGTKTLGRPALNWVDTGTANFLQGEFKSAIVDSNGIVRPAPLSQQLATMSLPFIWSITGDNSHNAYLGSGEDNNAEVFRINAAGEKSLFFKTPGIAVTSLAVDSSNNVYAAVSPGGKVYKISPAGKSRLIFDSEQPFVWALTWDDSGQLLVGTGGEHGKLYRILTDTSIPADPLPLHVFTEGHVRAVSVAPDGKIYVGTGAAGVLYQVDPTSGNANALYEVTAPGGNQNGEVLAVAASAKGVYFGTSVNGTFYRWTPQGGAEALYPSPQKTVYALQLNNDGTLYMATGDSGVVYHMTPGDSAATTHAARILEPTQQQALSLYLTQGSDSRLLVGMGNNGAAYEIPVANAPSGTFTSRVFDTQSKVQWGALRAVKDSATILTRSGNTSVPDATWSDWQDLKSLSDGQMQVASPDSRYLQYKVLLSGNANPSSAFARVEISYRTENQPPVVTLTAPKSGVFWKGKKSITWTGTDPDKDTLLYNLSLLTPDKQWKDVSDEPLKESPFSLDTTKWADGSYQLKLIASDMLSNPLHPKTATVQTLPFVIDNTPPVITGSRVEMRNKVRYINADISDATSPVVGVEWRIATNAKDDDSSDETSNGTNPNPNKASNSLTIRTGDKLVMNTTDKTAEEIAANSTDDTTDATADQDDDDTSDTDASTDADVSTKTKTDVDGWHALSALDGLFDSQQESAIGILQFTQKEIDAQNGKPFQIELRAHDAAGNIVTLTIEVPV